MAAPSPTVRHPERAQLAFAACTSLFVVVLVLTNVIGTKFFYLSWTDQVLTSGIITYPLTFLLTDLVSEIWGRRRANFMVIAGFGMSLLMLAILQLAIALPPAAFWAQEEMGFADGPAMQIAFEATFANPGVLLFASMLAYLVAQLFDVRLYHFWWKVTGGRHMWLRNNGSTAISQLVDTIIVLGIFLHFGRGYGPEHGFDLARIFGLIWGTYLCKLALAVIDTPLIYLARAGMERLLGIEHDPSRGRAPLD